MIRLSQYVLAEMIRISGRNIRFGHPSYNLFSGPHRDIYLDGVLVTGCRYYTDESYYLTEDPVEQHDIITKHATLLLSKILGDIDEQ